jgi:ABC-type uncharacterized transport system ATPase subunit
VICAPIPSNGRVQTPSLAILRRPGVAEETVIVEMMIPETLHSRVQADFVTTVENPLLSVHDVFKQFDTQDGPLVAVDHVSFDVVPGEFFTVIGLFGSCTRLKIIA